MRKLLLIVLVLAAGASLLPARNASQSLAAADKWLKQLQDAPDTEAGQKAFAALAALGPAALPALQRGLEHPQPKARWQALLLLARLKLGTAEKVAALRPAVQSSDAV